MKVVEKRRVKRGTVLVMIVGLLAMLFMIVTAYITLARFDRLTTAQLAKGEQVEQILTEVQNVLVTQIVSRGETPGESVKGSKYTDLPGSPWLAQYDPVRIPDPNVGWEGARPADYRYGALTSTSEKAVGTKTIAELMFDGDESGAVVVDPANPAAPSTDTRFNAQNPVMDADADGVPDTSFAGVALATELSNAMVGHSVQADFDPARLDPGDTNEPAYKNYQAWRQFNPTARYATAVRVVSHGGMVLLGESDEMAWNRAFIRRMFNYIRHPEDTDTSLDVNPGSDDPNVEGALQSLTALSGTVEPLLRRRGGLLVSANTSESLPPALSTLQSKFKDTFEPYYQMRPQVFKRDDWQRFNLASTDTSLAGMREWDAWRYAVNMDADAYNEALSGGGSFNPSQFYVRRRLITTTNNSDELARELNGNYSRKSGSAKRGIDPGQLKFYLGRINNAFDPTSGFFTAGGNGTRIVGELADYFTEMLSDYNLAATSDPNYGYQAQREQALMLAVNTVAFAAPRVDNGWIDTVWYQDAVTGNTYCGYAPQPFITQVMAYTRPPGDPNTLIAGPTSVVVELCNPNEPYSLSDPNDPYALCLEQFALSLNDGQRYTLSNSDPSGAVAYFPTRMRGRSFMKVVMHADGPDENDYFETQFGLQFMELESDIPRINTIVSTGGADIKAKLWRRVTTGPTGAFWIQVDEFDVDEPEPPAASAEFDPTDPNSWELWNGAWTDGWRDTRSETYWGPASADPDDPNAARPRWRCATEVPATYTLVDHEDHETDGKPHTDIALPGAWSRLRHLGRAGPYGDTDEPFGPTTPLYTMNAQLGSWVVNGSPRPTSFPTVGFMLFVPRFSHLLRGTGVYESMPERLGIEWRKPGLDGSHGPYPTRMADFGHMAIFDNTVPVFTGASSDFADSKTGRVPWGLLVFDYFTTLDVNGVDGIAGSDDDIDPYRVPGRININAAPWFVMAGLPLIGPSVIADQASPAFRSTEAGILIGSDAAGTNPRFSAVVDSSVLATIGWRRLGPYLAQSVAAYRDRVPYVTPGVESQAFVGAERRNGYQAGGDPNAPSLNPYRLAAYGPIRGSREIELQTASSTWKRGFLTLGELVNVMGFDSSTSAQVMAGAPVLNGSTDFFKAVSLMALLDTHYLTTRSNTFTIYTTLTDRTDPQASVRSQVTIDRSGLLPRLFTQDINGDGIPDYINVLEGDGEPEIVGKREVSYYNARYDN